MKFLVDKNGDFHRVEEEIVRCKDCKWRNNCATSSKWLPCMSNRYDDNWFCADGERKESK